MFQKLPTSGRGLQRPRLSFGGELGRSAMVFVSSFLAIALLQFESLRSFFIFDDLSIMVHVSPGYGKTLADCFGVMSNGFWRPLNMTLFWVIESVFGRTPLVFHLACLLIHAGVATATYRAAREVFQLDSRFSMIAAAILTVHAGGFECTLQFANTFDSTLALFILLSLIGWQAWTGSGSRRGLLLFLGSLLLAGMTKEAFVVIPVAALLLSWTSGRLTAGVWKTLGAAGFACGGLTAWRILHLGASHSYAQQGRFVTSPRAMAAQVADYCGGLFVPYVRLMEWPIGSVEFSTVELRCIRAVVFAAIVAAAIVFLVRSSARARLLPFGLAILIMAPNCVLAPPPASRYLYASIPFFAIGIAGEMSRLRGWRRGVALAFASLIAAGHIAGFAGSESIRGFNRAARNVGEFVTQVQVVSEHWESDQYVSVFDHPHPGDATFRWVYCQELFNLFIPERRAIVVLDRTVPETRYAYLFQDGKLIELEKMHYPAPGGS